MADPPAVSVLFWIFVDHVDDVETDQPHTQDPPLALHVLRNTHRTLTLTNTSLSQRESHKTGASCQPPYKIKARGQDGTLSPLNTEVILSNLIMRKLLTFNNSKQCNSRTRCWYNQALMWVKYRFNCHVKAVEVCIIEVELQIMSLSWRDEVSWGVTQNTEKCN